jgi:chromosome partitioning protein
LRTIAIASQKGGVGKTTTTISLGAALAARERRVLLIDADPQECLGAALGIQTPAAGASLSEVLLGDVELSKILVEAHGLTVAPAGADLAEAEARLLNEPARETRLRDALEEVASRFDYCLIDCPPSLGVLTLNGLTAARETLLCAQTEFLALRRLGAMLRTVEKVRKYKLNAKLQVTGILPTMLDARTLHGREVVGQIRDVLGKDHTIFSPIPRSIRFAEAPVAGQPIFAITSDHEGAQAYTSLAKEIDA